MVKNKIITMIITVNLIAIGLAGYLVGFTILHERTVGVYYAESSDSDIPDFAKSDTIYKAMRPNVGMLEVTRPVALIQDENGLTGQISNDVINQIIGPLRIRLLDKHGDILPFSPIIAEKQSIKGDDGTLSTSFSLSIPDNTDKENINAAHVVVSENVSARRLPLSVLNIQHSETIDQFYVWTLEPQELAPQPETITPAQPQTPQNQTGILKRIMVKPQDFNADYVDIGDDISVKTPIITNPDDYMYEGQRVSYVDVPFENPGATAYVRSLQQGAILERMCESLEMVTELPACGACSGGSCITP